MAPCFAVLAPASPSSRRAWIEIAVACALGPAGTVALLAEGVDRNRSVRFFASRLFGSPSSRRAWIEIFIHVWLKLGVSVALLAEGVDRNKIA